jgi:hypothetical protein
LKALKTNIGSMKVRNSAARYAFAALLTVNFVGLALGCPITS